MTWWRAPLYVLAHDVARQLGERLRERDGDWLAGRVREDSLQLLHQIGLALTFPDRRDAALRRADEDLLRLRLSLRLSRDLGLFSPRATRHLQHQLDTAGRMLGGWRKQLRKPRRGNRRTPGLEPDRRSAGAAGRQLQEHGQELPVRQPQQEHP